MSIKFRVSLGALEFDYEGSEEFFKAEIISTIEALLQLKPINSSEGVGNKPTADSNRETGSPLSGQPLLMSTNNIAAKLASKSGPDLVIAACAHIAIVLGKDTFTRKEILDDMQSATSYYKESYSKSLSYALTSLLKDNKLIERSSSLYALPADHRQQIEATIAR